MTATEKEKYNPCQPIIPQSTVVCFVIDAPQIKDKIMWNAKDIYYVSDSTALMAEDMGQALLCQFPEISFNEEKIPFIKTVNDAKKALNHIQQQSTVLRPLVFCTIVDKEVRNIFNVADVEFFDLYSGFLTRLEECLEAKAIREPGCFRHADDQETTRRVNAIHYALEHDDGQNIDEYDEADLILVGVSRSGKTPVSVYLATHMALKTANFPLTADHLEKAQLPAEIVRNRNKTVGLTTSPLYLHKIREKRYKGSTYASLATCNSEVRRAEDLYMQHGIKTINTEGKSIEEVSVQAIKLIGYNRHGRR